MKITIAKDAGYCFGVRDAVDMAYEISKKDGNVYMLGDIVHNENVINDLDKAGAKVVQTIDDVPIDKPLLLRAHGSKRNVWKTAKEKGMNILEQAGYR